MSSGFLAARLAIGTASTILDFLHETLLEQMIPSGQISMDENSVLALAAVLNRAYLVQELTRAVENGILPKEPTYASQDSRGRRRPFRS
jgi:adenylosuccinate synthase